MSELGYFMSPCARLGIAEAIIYLSAELDVLSKTRLILNWTSVIKLVIIQ